MQNEISERLKILPKVIQLLSQGSSLSCLYFFPQQEKSRAASESQTFFFGGGRWAWGMSKQLRISGKSQTLMQSKPVWRSK